LVSAKYTAISGTVIIEIIIKMDFEKAVIAAVEQFGSGIVGEDRLTNILSDMNAYVEHPACKRILREVINSGVSMNIRTQPSTDLAKVYISQVVLDMSKSHGFQIDLIEYVLYSILNAIKPEEERIQQNLGLQYEYIGSEDEFGFCDVRKNGKWGFLSSDRKEVVPTIYDSVGSFHEGLADVSKDGKFGFVDTTGKVVIKLTFDNVYGFRFGIAKVVILGQYGLINKGGRMILPAEYDDIAHVSGGMIAICKNNLWGFADITGRVVIPPQYKEIIKHFSKGYAAVSDGCNKIVINNQGELIQYI
jgi:hypothetical protein